MEFDKESACYLFASMFFQSLSLQFHKLGQSPFFFKNNVFICKNFAPNIWASTSLKSKIRKQIVLPIAQRQV